MKKKLLVIGIWLTCFYLALPFYSAYRLKSAFYAGDQRRLERDIDFPSLRASLKEQSGTPLVRKLLQESLMTAAIVGLMPQSIIDQSIDNIFTPAMLSNAVADARKRARASSEEMPEIGISDVKWAFFTGPATFSVFVKDLELLFDLRGMRWKLTGIRFVQ